MSPHAVSSPSEFVQRESWLINAPLSCSAHLFVLLGLEALNMLRLFGWWTLALGSLFGQWTARASKCGRGSHALPGGSHIHEHIYSLASIHVIQCGHANMRFIYIYSCRPTCLNVKKKILTGIWSAFYLWFQTMTDLQYTLYCTISITAISNAARNGMSCSKKWFF